MLARGGELEAEAAEQAAAATAFEEALAEARGALAGAAAEVDAVKAELRAAESARKVGDLKLQASASLCPLRPPC